MLVDFWCPKCERPARGSAFLQEVRQAPAALACQHCLAGLEFTALPEAGRELTGTFACYVASTPPVHRRPLAQPRGKCRWLGADPVTGCQVLAINGVPYDVVQRGAGYELTRLDPATFQLRTYRVDPARGACTCPDATQRRRECKHVLALRAALAKRPAAV